MLLLSSKPCIVGKLYSFGCCMCQHFEEHQTIHRLYALHAMPLAQAVTTVVAQPCTNACRLHCVKYFYSTTLSLQMAMKYMSYVWLFVLCNQDIKLDQTNFLGATSLDFQFSCVFHYANIPQISQMSSLSPLFADSTFNFPNTFGTTSQDQHLNKPKSKR